jgi:glutamate--cysteine ligase
MLDRQDLIEDLASGCTAPQDWRLGFEHEQFCYDRATGRPLAYEGAPGIRSLLEGFAETYGWVREYEADNLIALHRAGDAITLEPGGQLEFSSAPMLAPSGIAERHHAFVHELNAIADNQGIGVLARGMPHDWARDDMPLMPKSRYQIMHDYLGKTGVLGRDMMLRSAGVQTSLDFADEQDMVAKMRLGIALQPVITALFANSDSTGGAATGFASYRAHLWADTDADRCGIPDVIFGTDMGFAAYVDYMLDVPMFGIVRDGVMIDLSGASFRDLMAGHLHDPDGNAYEATRNDWHIHLTTAFPQVRLKHFIEMRDADSCDAPLVFALPAFWAGLFYDAQAMEMAQALVQDWTLDDHRRLRHDVARHGLAARVPDGRCLRDFAPDILRLAHDGLMRQYGTEDGAAYLQPLIERSRHYAERPMAGCG